MGNKAYRLTFLPLFEDDLNEIVDYITFELKNPEAANRLVDAVEAALMKRLDNPIAFAPYQSMKERTHRYYRINVHNYCIFYVVIEDVMEVRRIIYKKRNIDNIIWYYPCQNRTKSFDRDFLLTNKY